MKKHFIIVVIFFSGTAFSQVGINTENPQATLDITASAGDLTNVDGIIDPQITGNELFLKNNLYGSKQQGTLIYVTAPATDVNLSGDTIDITEVGYYYYNGVKWVKINGQNYTSSASVALSSTNTFERAALTGDVTAAANSNQTTISNNAIISEKILDGTISTVDLADQAVTAFKLADNSVNTTKIIDGAVTTVDLADQAVTDFKLADNSVNTTKIVDGTIATVDLADNSVNSTKIIDGTIATVDLEDQTVTAIKLADNSVNTTKIIDGEITTADLADQAVTAFKLADDSVNTTKIIDGTIATVDLADQAVTAIKLADNSVNTTKIIDGTISTADLADNSVTTAKIVSSSTIGQVLTTTSAGVVTWKDPTFVSQVGAIKTSGTLSTFPGGDVSTGFITLTPGTWMVSAKFSTKNSENSTLFTWLNLINATTGDRIDSVGSVPETEGQRYATPYLQVMMVVTQNTNIKVVGSNACICATIATDRGPGHFFAYKIK